MQVIIMMATYNGEAYISEQINSILSQDYSNFILVVHDDGSKDNTAKILYDYAIQHPNRLEIVPSNPTGGAKNNFSFLMTYVLSKYTEHQYFMFSDQDDIWDSDKITRTMEMMKNLETLEDRTMPLLIHTDLRLIDNIREELSSSFFKYQNLNYVWAEQFPKILTQNVVTGCTVMINLPLLKIGADVPKEAVMHDWWLALLACAWGKVGFLDEPTMSYRQHQSNEVGAKKFDIKYVLFKITHFWHNKDRVRWTEAAAMQAKAFYNTQNSIVHKIQAKEFSELRNAGFKKRMKIIIKNGFYKIGWQRNFAWLFLK